MVKNLAERESKGHSLLNLELINIFQCLGGKNRWLNVDNPLGVICKLSSLN